MHHSNKSFVIRLLSIMSLFSASVEESFVASSVALAEGINKKLPLGAGVLAATTTKRISPDDTEMLRSSATKKHKADVDSSSEEAEELSYDSSSESSRVSSISEQKKSQRLLLKRLTPSRSFKIKSAMKKDKKKKIPSAFATQRACCLRCGNSCVNGYILNLHIEKVHKDILGKYTTPIKFLGNDGKDEYQCRECTETFKFKGDACKHFNTICFAALIKKYGRQPEEKEKKTVQVSKTSVARVLPALVSPAPVVIAPQEVSPLPQESVDFPAWIIQDTEIFLQSVPGQLRILPPEAFKGKVLICGGCEKEFATDEECINHLQACKRQRELKAWQVYCNLFRALRCPQVVIPSKEGDKGNGNNPADSDIFQIQCPMPICKKIFDDLVDYDKHALGHRKRIQTAMKERLTLYAHVLSKPFEKIIIEGSAIPYQVVETKGNSFATML